MTRGVNRRRWINQIFKSHHSLKLHSISQLAPFALMKHLKYSFLFGFTIILSEHVMGEFCNSERCNLGPKANYLVFWKEKPRKRKSPQKRRQSRCYLDQLPPPATKANRRAGFVRTIDSRLFDSSVHQPRLLICVLRTFVLISPALILFHLFKRNESLPNFEALIALDGLCRENQRRLHISSNILQSSDQT